MTKLYILRHGQSEWNVLNKVQGQLDIDLTDIGIKQAKKAAKRLKDENIVIIYSSDLKRAFDTAEIIGQELNLKTNKLSGLREICFGIWEGLDLETVKNEHQEDFMLWRTQAHNIKFEQGEDLLEVQNRMLKDVNKIISENPGKNILLVSHGTAIKTLILGLLDIDISKYNKMAMGNTGLSVIEFREFSAVLKLYNETNHIKED